MANQNDSFINKVGSVYGVIKDVTNNSKPSSSAPNIPSHGTPIQSGYGSNRFTLGITPNYSGGWQDASTNISSFKRNLAIINSKIGNSEKDIWYGVSANTLKGYLSSLIEVANVIEQNVSYLEESVSLKDNIQSALNMYAVDDMNYRNLVSQRNSGVEISSFEIRQALERRNNSWNALKTATSNLTQKLNQIKNASFNSVPTNKTETDIYQINITEVTNEVANRFNSSISLLENLKSKLNNSKYNNETLKSKIGIISPINVHIGNYRDRIIRIIENLQTRMEQINNRINAHLENITAFENNETVEVKNGEASLVQKTVTEEKEVNETYNVKAGDTLIGIASKYDGVSWQSIYEANKNNPNAMPNGDYKQLVVGASLIIPGVTQTVSKTTTSATNEVVDIIESEKLPQLETFESSSLVDFNKLSQTNWNITDAPSMAVGEYSAPMAVNQNGYMLDDSNSTIKVTSPLGYRKNPFTGKTEYHKGVDYSGGNYDNGTKIKSVGPGVVIATNNNDSNKGLGNYVKVLHEVVDEKGNYSYQISVYGHLEDALVEPGTIVNNNTTIGTMGNSGNSTGDHLHLQISKIPGLKPENLYGKSAEEVVKYTETAKINGKVIAATNDWGRENLVDSEAMLKENGVKMERGK